MHYAFDIGGSKIEFGVFDDAGQQMMSARIATPTQDRDAFIAALRSQIDAADNEFSAQNANRRPEIGISFAGGLDPQSGAVISANIPAITGWPIGPSLRKILDRPVHVANDADCFTLAEARLGAARHAETVFAIILGTGVGGGIVVNGRFMGGRSGIRGEWGHGNDMSGGLIRHGLSSVPCGCGGANCLDSWGAARGLERIYQQQNGQFLPSHEITALWQAAHGRTDDDGVGTGAGIADGDDPAAAIRAVDVFVDLVAGELALMVNVLDPDCVPVGGGLASQAALIDVIDAQVRRRVLGRYDHRLVVPGVFYRDGGLRGAAMLHLLADRGGL